MITRSSTVSCQNDARVSELDDEHAQIKSTEPQVYRWFMRNAREYVKYPGRRRALALSERARGIGDGTSAMVAAARALVVGGGRAAAPPACGQRGIPS